MYRLWTSIYALGADLAAYRSTLLQPQPGHDELATRRQAGGYITFALGHYADVLLETRRFEHAHGGLWLLSDHQAEQDVADALYRTSWHTPNNERDNLYLRDLADRNPEQHPFMTALGRETIGMEIHDDWQAWARACDCGAEPS